MDREKLGYEPLWLFLKLSGSSWIFSKLLGSSVLPKGYPQWVTGAILQQMP